LAPDFGAASKKKKIGPIHPGRGNSLFIIGGLAVIARNVRLKTHSFASPIFIGFTFVFATEKFLS
jgi:hypothetical protein